MSSPSLYALLSLNSTISDSISSSYQTSRNVIFYSAINLPSSLSLFFWWLFQQYNSGLFLAQITYSIIGVLL